MRFQITLDDRDPALLHEAFAQARSRGDRQYIAKALMLVGVVTMRNAESSPLPWPSPSQIKGQVDAVGKPTAAAQPPAIPTIAQSPVASYAQVPDDILDSLTSGYP